MKLFRVKILTEKQLLAEEGGVNTQVFIVLKGGVQFFRRMPGDKKITVVDKKPEEY